MKKILLLSTLIIGSVLINKAEAQVDIDANAGVQPEWGPSGYDNAAYYYLPDIEAYYCIPTHEFTWLENGQWVSSLYLPERYANYDLYGGYKVVLNERNPWFHFYDHRRMYASYRYRHDQVVIRDYRGRGNYGVNYGRADYGRAGYGQVNYGHNNYGRADYSHNNYGRSNNNYGHTNYDNRGSARREDYSRGRSGEQHNVERMAEHRTGRTYDKGDSGGGQEHGNSGRGQEHSNSGRGQDRGYEHGDHGRR